ncbi:MAG: YIP1 family protein [Gemmatimonadetes bacterium]|nr:YIP1 family protein [Gemmatimonadota bacterium]
MTAPSGSTEPTDTNTVAPADAPGVLEDFIDIFVSPAKVFARRAKEGGTAAFFIVAIALSGMLYTGKSVMEPIMEAQMSKGMAAAQKANPNMTNEQMEAAKGFQRKLMPVFMVIGAPIALVFVGVLTWMVGKPFGAAITFGSSMMIAAYGYVPRIVAAVITDVQGLLMNDTSRLTDAAQLSLGPARFFDPATTSPLTLALLLRLDVVTLWVTLLLAIGLYSAGKLTKEKTIAAGITLWVVGSLFPLWGAYRQM